MQSYNLHRNGDLYDYRNDSAPFIGAFGRHSHDLMMDHLQWIIDRRRRRVWDAIAEAAAAGRGVEPSQPLFLQVNLQTPHCPLDELPERYLLPYKDFLHELFVDADVVGGLCAENVHAVACCRCCAAALIW